MSVHWFRTIPAACVIIRALFSDWQQSRCVIPAFLARLPTVLLQPIAPFQCVAQVHLVKHLTILCVPLVVTRAWLPTRRSGFTEAAGEGTANEHRLVVEVVLLAESECLVEIATVIRCVETFLWVEKYIGYFSVNVGN